MRRVCRALFYLMAMPILGLLTAALYWQINLPDSYQVGKGGSISLPRPVSVFYSADKAVNASFDSGGEYQAELKLPLGVAVKTVAVKKVDRAVVTVSGQPFGIKMFTNGLMVVGMSDFATDDGRKNPGKQAGVTAGDILLRLDGITLISNEQFSALVQASQGRRMQLVYESGGIEKTTWIEPLKNAADGQYHLGIWVRDSSAGVGTITYYDAAYNVFSGLGHAVCDVDTGELMTLSSGEAVEARIIGCIPSRSGSPGELKGQFIANREFADLTANTVCGVFGVLSSGYSLAGTEMPVALEDEIHAGDATILTTIEGQTPKEYSVRIEKILRGSSADGQNMVIRITDKELLSATGGIVQGMSGSPIIQDGMLVGAVTHVFVNEPEQGYGIFAENIRDKEESLYSEIKDAA